MRVRVRVRRLAAPHRLEEVERHLRLHVLAARRAAGRTLPPARLGEHLVELREDVLRALAAAEPEARKAARPKRVAAAAAEAAGLTADASMAVRVVPLLLTSVGQHLVRRGRV